MIVFPYNKTNINILNMNYGKIASVDYPCELTKTMSRNDVISADLAYNFFAHVNFCKCEFKIAVTLL